MANLIANWNSSSRWATPDLCNSNLHNYLIYSVASYFAEPSDGNVLFLDRTGSIPFLLFNWRP